jgi:hypothetical protein
VAFKLITFLLAGYRLEAPNSFAAGGKRLGLAIDVSEGTANKALDELIEKGHCIVERPGRNRGHKGTRERVVSLTRWDSDARKGDPDLPNKIWQRTHK